MFRALLCPSSGARGYNVGYHIGRVVLGLLYIGGKVLLGWSSVRAARILFMSLLFCIIFLGSVHYSSLFYFRVTFVSFLFLWVRGIVLRFSYDKLTLYNRPNLKSGTRNPPREHYAWWSQKILRKSDVWLTVHRNSVWIRKTN